MALNLGVKDKFESSLRVIEMAFKPEFVRKVSNIAADCDEFLGKGH